MRAQFVPLKQNCTRLKPNEPEKMCAVKKQSHSYRIALKLEQHKFCLLLQDAVKVMAKSLVRNRHAVTKMYSLKSQLQAVSLRMAVSPCLSHSNEFKHEWGLTRGRQASVRKSFVEGNRPP